MGGEKQYDSTQWPAELLGQGIDANNYPVSGLFGEQCREGLETHVPQE